MAFTRKDVDRIALERLQKRTTPNLRDKLRQAALRLRTGLPKQTRT